jgi:serine/threonine protein kinase
LAGWNSSNNANRLSVISYTEDTNDNLELEMCGSGNGDRCLQDYNIIKIIGKGGFGKVYLVQNKNTEQYFAMKCMRKDEILDFDKVDSMLQEKQISNEVRHPFIVNVDECFQTDIRLYFIMRFVRGGQLTTHLKKAEKFND